MTNPTENTGTASPRGKLVVKTLSCHDWWQASAVATNLPRWPGTTGSNGAIERLVSLRHTTCLRGPALIEVIEEPSLIEEAHPIEGPSLIEGPRPWSMHHHAWECDKDVAGLLHTVSCSGRRGRMLVEWADPADAEARYASSRRADVPELAPRAAGPRGMEMTARRRSAGAPCRAGPSVMERDHLLESGPTSPLPSRVWRRFPTPHEFRGKP